VREDKQRKLPKSASTQSINIGELMHARVLTERQLASEIQFSRKLLF
jgi:hypothetical protein